MGKYWAVHAFGAGGLGIMVSLFGTRVVVLSGVGFGLIQERI